MKPIISAITVALLASVGYVQPAAAATASKVGDVIQIGCTLPAGQSGSVVYSIDNDNSSFQQIDLAGGITLGASCSQALNVFTPKTDAGNHLILNCGQASNTTGTILGFPAGAAIGVWQASGITGNAITIPLIPPAPPAPGISITINLGAAQPVLLVPPANPADYALVSYTFVCSSFPL